MRAKLVLAICLLALPASAQPAGKDLGMVIGGARAYLDDFGDLRFYMSKEITLDSGTRILNRDGKTEVVYPETFEVVEPIDMAVYPDHYYGLHVRLKYLHVVYASTTHVAFALPGSASIDINVPEMDRSVLRDILASCELGGRKPVCAYDLAGEAQPQPNGHPLLMRPVLIRSTPQ